MNQKPYSTRGFTLVELMVAITLAMVAMLAATELYSNTRQTYRLQGMQSRLAEDGRYAQAMLQRVLLQANFRPVPTDAAVAGFITPDTSTPGKKFQVKFNGDATNTVDCAGAPVNGVTTLTIQESSSQLLCGSTEWISGHGTELVSFSVQYGIDTAAPSGTAAAYLCATSPVNRDCVADSYTTTVTTINQIVAVRICMVLRTTEVDASVTRASAYKACDGTTNIIGSDSDHRLYRTFNSTILIRNR